MAKKRKDKAPLGLDFVACSNPKVRQAYEIEEKFEAGMVLTGSEVKSLREKRADLEGAYAAIDSNGELWLHKAYIGPYAFSGPYFGHEERRPRKLLMHRHELKRLQGALTLKGLTLVPTQIYFKKGRAKVELALARGKKKGDQREDLKRQVELREAREAMERHRR
ncbi:MAG: SsrA-binding protein SmpB [Sandaracinaceae bacterium]|nr:SsrA-binding protein SmpB [Sandaracinaceae bacterium]